MKDLKLLFQNIKNETHDLNNHKNELRRFLQNSTYFKNETDNGFDLKLIFSSLSLAVIAIVFMSAMSPRTIYDPNNNLYDRVSKMENMKELNFGDNHLVLEISQDSVNTTLYFNNNKKLINSNINK